MSGRTDERESILRGFIEDVIYGCHRSARSKKRDLEGFPAYNRIQIDERHAALAQSTNMFDEMLAVTSHHVFIARGLRGDF